jgi:hypothetical protein
MRRNKGLESSPFFIGNREGKPIVQKGVVFLEIK